MTRKKYQMNIPGLSGIISYKRNYLIVAEDYKVVVYDLETLEPITKLSIRHVLGMDLNPSEDMVYCYTVDAIKIFSLETFRVLKVLEPELTDEEEWEIKQCYSVGINLLLLVVLLLGGDYLVVLCDTEDGATETIITVEEDDAILFDKKHGLQIVKGDFYQPRSESNDLQIEQRHYQSEQFLFNTDIEILKLSAAETKKSGNLCYGEPEGKFFLAIEYGFFQSYYLFLDQDFRLIERIKAPMKDYPSEICYYEDYNLLILFYVDKKIVVLDTKNNRFQICTILDAVLPFGHVLFKETKQLLIFEAEKIQWVDLDQFS